MRCQWLIARAVSGVMRLSGNLAQASRSARFRVLSGSSIRSQHKKSKITWSRRLLHQFVPVAPRQCLYELRLLELTLNFGASKAIWHNGQAKVAQEQEATIPWRTAASSQPCGLWSRFCTALCVLATMCTACFCSSAATMRRAGWVSPVPGKPVRSKEPPAKQRASTPAPEASRVL